MGWKAILEWLTTVGECETAGGRALVVERFNAYQQHIPLIHTFALTNLVGMYLVTGGTVDRLFHPIPLLVGFVVLRLFQWHRMRNRSLNCYEALAELRKSWCIALLISIAFGAWTLHHLSSQPDDHTVIVFFASLAALGCSYAMASFPAAARQPLLFLALPVTVHQILSPDPAQVGTGISLGLLALLVLRLIQGHDRSFAQLVRSRSEITEEREIARRAEAAAESAKLHAIRLADTDPLTGLLNRRAFVRDLASELARDTRGATLALVDLNGFKPINDTFGHSAGDAVLRRVADRIARSVSGARLVARMGGDEFAIFFRDCWTAEAAQVCGDQICAALQSPVKLDDREFHVGLSCGVALISDCDVSEALFRADAAMYRAKRQRSVRSVVYSAALDESSRRRAVIEESLRTPGIAAEMRLVFQPICELKGGKLRAFEALARWEHSSIGTVSPNEFIPIAEHINVIGPLTEELLRRAAKEAAEWESTIKLSFNVSAVQLCARGSAERLLRILNEAGLAPSQLQIELTETALLADYEVARTNLRTLRSAGTRILLDDFGAGHASVSYLREMRFDGLKLDGSFLSRISDSLRSQQLLTGVLGLSQSIGLSTIAEHIETKDQLDLLRRLGCAEGQGYFISQPLSPEEAFSLAAPNVVLLPFRGFRPNRVA